MTDRDEEIVVTATMVATKTETDRLKLPQVVDTVNGELIEQQQARDLSDILRNVPGAVVSSAEGFGYPNLTLRGFYADADGSQRRNNVETSKFGNLYRPNVEYVEVLKGPSSVVYGSLEPGGVVNVVTRKPLATAAYRFTTWADSFGDIEQIGDLTGPLNASGTLRYRLIGSARHYDSYRNHIDGFHYFLAPSLSFVPSSDTTITIELERNREKHPYDPGIYRPDGLAGIGRGDRDLFLGLPRRDAEFAYTSIHGTIEQRFGSAFSMRGYVSYTNYDIARRSGTLGTYSPATQTITRSADFGHIEEDLLDIDVNGTLAFHLIGDHKLTVGVQRQHTHLDDNRFPGTLDPIDIFDPILTDGTIAPADRLRTTITTTKGIYAQDSMDYGPLTLLAGLRYTDYSNRIDTTMLATEARTTLANPSSKTVFRVGGLYRVRPDIALFASWSQGFLPVNPLIGTAEDGSPFKPREDRQYEAGVKLDLFDRRLLITGAVYDLRRENVVSYDAAFIPRQGGVNRSRGIEFSATGRVTDRLNIALAYAYTEAEVRENDPRYPIGQDLGAPRHVFNLFGDYRISDRFDINGGVYALSKHATFLSSAGAGRYIPGYALVQIGGGYRFTDKIRLTASVKNLLDKNYSVQYTNTNVSIPGEPRALYATLDIGL